MRVITRYVEKVVIINHSYDFNNIKPSIDEVKIGVVSRYTVIGQYHLNFIDLQLNLYNQLPIYERGNHV